MNKPYRDCVVAVIQNQEGLVLCGERSDHPGSWQLPQGGIDAGESAEQAIMRELQEEIGNQALTIQKVSDTWISYDFPSDMNEGPARRFRGQRQKWYLLHFQKGEQPHLELADGEFSALSWISIADLNRGIVVWKKQAYAEGFAALGLQI